MEPTGPRAHEPTADPLLHCQASQRDDLLGCPRDRDYGAGLHLLEPQECGTALPIVHSV